MPGIAERRGLRAVGLPKAKFASVFMRIYAWYRIILLTCTQRSCKSGSFTSGDPYVQSLSMQIALLYRSVPALTAIFRIQSITGLRLGQLKPPGTLKLPLYSVTTAIRGASTIAEGPSTDLGAGLPEIIETSNVPVRPPDGLSASFMACNCVRFQASSSIVDEASFTLGCRSICMPDGVNWKKRLSSSS